VAGILELALIVFFNILNGSSQLPTAAHMKNTGWWMFTRGLLESFDHFGLLGNRIHLLITLRTLGIILLISGVYILQTH
jgi:transporter family-2 protein